MLVIGSNSASTGYNLTRSLRTRASVPAYLGRAPATTTNRQTWTWSCWVKRGTLGSFQRLFGATTNANDETSGIRFNSSDVLDFIWITTGASTITGRLITTQVFRDPSAWYHIVLAVDTTQATAANRFKLYINGTQVTAFGTATYPSQNDNGYINQATLHRINAEANGTNASTPNQTFDGYSTEINFIDGQQLTPSSFGSTNALTGVWQPAAYTGSYGTNGFFLQFTDPTSAISLGYDAIPATRITSGSGTYTIPAYTSSLVVECWGGGGGGAGTTNGSVAATAGTGGATTFSTLTANGGIGGTGAQDNVVNGSGGAGGTASGGDVNITGNTGLTNYYTGSISGATAPNGGLGALVNTASSTVGPGGGGGSGGAPSTAAGGGGGSGGYVKKTYAPGAISGSVSYSIGAAGTAGAGGSFNGIAGAAGGIRITVDGVRVDNDWYPRGISVAAGVTYDSMTDVPTLTSATAANYCTFNPLAYTNVFTYTNANLTASGTGAGVNVQAQGTMAISSGKFYWEITDLNGGAGSCIGISDITVSSTTSVGTSALSYGYLATSGNKINNGSSVAYGATFTANDVIGVALDLTAGTLVFYKNNTSQGTAYTGLAGTFLPAVSDSSGASTPAYTANFGQRPFSYTPPTGFVALNTYNLPTSTIVKGNTVMDATLYTGNGSTQTITNAAAFKPDLVWIKGRSSSSQDHTLVDSVRGVSRRIRSNATTAEVLESGFTVTAFNSSGFTAVDDTNGGYNVNGSIGGTFSGAALYVGWQWQAGQGSTSSNTNGSITSTVSVNASAGFSVVTYVGNGTIGATVGHGLGVAPSMIIVKNRGTASAWSIYHASLGATKAIYFDTSAGAASLEWNNTAPTSSVFSLYSFSAVNQNTGNLVAYCWTPIAGFSAFGSLTGNGSADGPFVYTGFKPRFILYKRTDSTSDWRIWDTARTPYNAMSSVLYPNGSDAEFTASSQDFDALSNGFKIRNSSASMNASGGTYIYAAFASNPFRNSLAQ